MEIIGTHRQIYENETPTNLISKVEERKEAYTVHSNR